MNPDQLKIKRLRYVRDRKRSYWPRKWVLPDEDWLYETTDLERVRPEKVSPPINSHAQQVYGVLSSRAEATEREIRDALPQLSASTVRHALEALHYRYMIDRVRDDHWRYVWIAR